MNADPGGSGSTANVGTLRLFLPLVLKEEFYIFLWGGGGGAAIFKPGHAIKVKQSTKFTN